MSLVLLAWIITLSSPGDSNESCPIGVDYHPLLSSTVMSFVLLTWIMIILFSVMSLVLLA